MTLFWGLIQEQKLEIRNPLKFFYEYHKGLEGQKRGDTKVLHHAWTMTEVR